jgi:hypothetical protein
MSGNGNRANDDDVDDNGERTAAAPPELLLVAKRTLDSILAISKESPGETRGCVTTPAAFIYGIVTVLFAMAFLLTIEIAYFIVRIPWTAWNSLTILFACPTIYDDDASLLSDGDVNNIRNAGVPDEILDRVEAARYSETERRRMRILNGTVWGYCRGGYCRGERGLSLQ